MKNFKSQILTELSNAQNSIKVAVSWVTDPTLIEKLIQKARENVEVEVIMSADKWNVLRFYDFKRLKSAGGKIRKFGPENVDEFDFMHCKYAIIDHQTVMEGSYNWSKNAQTNREQLRVDSSTYRSNELLADFQYMLQNAKCYFDGITNPKAIIEKFKPLEDNAIQPHAHERVKYEVKLKAAEKINIGAAATTKTGTIVSTQPSSKTTNMPNKKHRFYGGRVTSYFKNDNTKNPFSKAAFQKYHLDKRYDFLESKIVNGKLVSTGIIKPNGCESYSVKVEWSAGFSPKVTIQNKEIEPKNEIHMYQDGSLCLFYPPDLKWKNNLKISDYIVPWVVEWVIFYELFLVTGKWLGPEAPHSLPN